MPLKMKKKIWEACTVPVLLYGSQTWATTESRNMKLARTLLAMERVMIGVKKERQTVQRLSKGENGNKGL